MSRRIVYQLAGTSACVSTLTTPGTASAGATSTVLEQRVVALGARHLEVQEAGRVAVLEELRAAGDVAERVGALDRRADDVEVVVAPLGEVGAVDLLGLDRHQTPPSTYWIPPAALRRCAASRIALMIDS